MRFPYAPKEAPADSPEDAAIYDRITKRRHPRPLIPLDLTLLHSPPVADGWNSFLGAIRTKTIIPQSILELAICRVAYLNNASYEWRGHAHLALKAGISEEGLQTVREVSMEEVQERAKEGTEGKGLGKKEWAVLAFTDQETRGTRVEDEVFDSVKGMFEQREVVELTAAVAAYNCASRFLSTLDVGELNGTDVKDMPLGN